VRGREQIDISPRRIRCRRRATAAQQRKIHGLPIPDQRLRTAEQILETEVEGAYFGAIRRIDPSRSSRARRARENDPIRHARHGDSRCSSVDSDCSVFRRRA
jgi:hypothetical protein